MTDDRTWVGPVLVPGLLASAVIAALEELNPELSVTDRGSYLRVLAPGRCELHCDAVERHAGKPFQLPRDLEQIMPSFQGWLVMTEREAHWESRRKATP